ncbi:membrane protein [Streptomyces sp. MUSC 125]|uniref:streptophobe family protein n=1 Tax=Streptomyces sp. MUSC 125 TaxID=1428624 RepID=UPI00057D71A4|nr:streptophobe family protein [Streptomyces sp. MUSC 125]KIE24483.1 membrane protein [Streptomyces sp. MUSC 125]
MNAAKGIAAGRHGAKLPWTDILLSAIAAVSWALIGMAGTAALGLHLLRADAAGSLGPMTAAVVALGAGGSVTPSGSVSAFGLKGAEAHTAIEITPLGVSLAGALLLAWFFLRSLRTAGVVIAPVELLARAGTVALLFAAMLGGLAWAGHDVVTIDGGSLGLDQLPGGSGGKGSGLSIPGLGDVGGLLPDRIGGLIHAKAAVGFTVNASATVLGGLGWCAGILLIALLASRRAPLPPGWAVLHRVVRPAVSALVTVLLVAVVAGLATAAYTAAGDAHPRRIAGAALLGTPNGVWLGIPLGLFVPWDGRATGVLGTLLSHPLDQLLSNRSDQPVTLDRLAELDGRVWLLAVAAGLLMLLAGILTAVRTPVGRPSGTALGHAGHCALRLGVATALALPLLTRLTDVSVDASLSVLGIDAFGAGIQLRGQIGAALLLGALWGAGAGAAGALVAWGTRAAGTRAVPASRTTPDAAATVRDGGTGHGPGHSGDGSPAGDPLLARAGHHEHSGHGEHGDGRWPSGRKGGAGDSGAGDRSERVGHRDGAARSGHGGARQSGAEAGADAGLSWPDQGIGGSAYGNGAGPYVPSRPYRAPNPDTNPYLQVPGEPPEPSPPAGGNDVYGAPTVAGPLGPPPPPPRRSPSRRPDVRPQAPADNDGPPPPPPPPPPGTPKRRR